MFLMPSVSLRAHYDGERIQLDEPFELPPDVPLLVTVLQPEADSDRAAWSEASRQALARAFGESEPEYTLDDLQK
jgi:hypothetical protein